VDIGGLRPPRPGHPRAVGGLLDTSLVPWSVAGTLPGPGGLSREAQLATPVAVFVLVWSRPNRPARISSTVDTGIARRGAGMLRLPAPTGLVLIAER
jgi:hypothetical protein